MIISHNQELMIHSIAFGSNNPMNKIQPIYLVTDENDKPSLNDLEEFADEIDDETLEKDLRVDVKDRNNDFRFDFHERFFVFSFD